MARPVIHSLTGIRAVAATWVIVFHLYDFMAGGLKELDGIQPLISAGNLGVDFFFILSGFIIAYNYSESLSRPTMNSYGRFLWLRVARIYPVHLVTLIAFAVLFLGAGIVGVSVTANDNLNPLSFVMNLLMLHSVPPAFAWNNPAWSISTEFAAYVLYPLLAMVLIRIRSLALLLSLTAGTFAIGIVSLHLILEDAESWRYWSGYAIIWIRIAVGFGAGALLHAIWVKVGSPRKTRSGDALIGLGFVGVVVAAVLTPQGAVIFLPSAALPFLALIVWGAATSQGPLARLLALPPVEWGGRVSYSIYMTHFLLMTVIFTLIPHATIMAMPTALRLGLAALIVASIIGVGAITYHFIEEPSRMLLRSLVGVRSRPATAISGADDPQPAIATPPEETTRDLPRESA